ncbi:hypothetical protein Tco_0636371, partial [Tanacetum coccineum]
EDYSIFDFTRDDEDDVVVADINNLDTTIKVNPNPTIRIHKDRPLNQVIGDLQSATQTRKMQKNLKEYGFISTIQQRIKTFKTACLLAFYHKKNPKRFTEVKTASTTMETQKPLLKDKNGEEVDVHMYRSMIDSLMYLTSSRPDIMFAVLYRNRQCCNSTTEAEYVDAQVAVDK